MSYKIVYTRQAVKDIRKLDDVAKKRLGSKIESYSKNPKQYSKKLSDSRLGGYRFRVGNYRVVFDIDGFTLVILRVGHRREIYK